MNGALLLLAVPHTGLFYICWQAGRGRARTAGKERKGKGGTEREEREERESKREEGRVKKQKRRGKIILTLSGALAVSIKFNLF